MLKQLRDALKSHYFLHLKSVLLYHDIRPKHTGYTKYILLGRSRTGSNFLRGLLSSHDQIVCYGELFSNYHKLRGGLA